MFNLIVLILVTIVFLMFGYLITHADIFSPFCVFCEMFLIAEFLCLFFVRMYKVEIHLKTILVIALGTISFGIVSAFFNMKRVDVRNYGEQHSRNYISINYLIQLVFLILEVLVVFYHAKYIKAVVAAFGYSTSSIFDIAGKYHVIALLPRASYYIQRGELKEFHRITRKALNFVFLMATPLFVYFIYFAKEGIFFLSGNNYVGSIIPMQVIMPTLLLIGITNILGIQILVPTGREKIVLYSEIVGAVVDVIINALLIPVYASTGAAIGTLVAEFAVFVVQFYALKDEILNTFRQIHYIKILIALSVGSIVSLWVKILNLECFFSLVISSLLFFGAYGFVLLILKEELFLEIFNTIKNKII